MVRALHIGRPLVHIALIVALGLLAYANSFGVPFQFDDTPNIVENPVIRDLRHFCDTRKAMPFQGFAEYPILKRRYIGSLSLALNYCSHDLDVTGYHAVNLAIHLGCALLVYALTILTFRSPMLRGSLPSGREHWAALAAGVLFALHPVQTQAVTYIVQRFASLAALFYLAALVCYARSRLSARAAARWVFYAAALICAVCAMKTKETAFTLPLAVALYEALFFEGTWRRRVALLVPIMATIVIIPATVLMMHGADFAQNISSQTQVKDIPRPEYFMTELRVLLTYLRLLALPIGQNLDYDYPLIGSVRDLVVPLSAALHAATLGVGIWLMRRRGVGRVVGMGVIWFYLTLSVESTLIVLEPIFEHRLYLPAAGVCMAAGAGVAWLYGHLTSERARAALVVCCVCVPLVLGALTVKRNAVWQSEITLWKDVSEKSPRKARPLYTLGLGYQHAGMVDKAIAAYRKAIASDPESYEAHLNYAVALWESGAREQAVVEFERSLAIEPSANGYYDLGVGYYRMKMYDSAAVNFQKAIMHHKGSPEPYVALTECYLMMGKPQQALRTAREGIGLFPWDALMSLVLGKSQYATGRTEDAWRTYERLSALNPQVAAQLKAHLDQNR